MNNVENKPRRPRRRPANRNAPQSSSVPPPGLSSSVPPPGLVNTDISASNRNITRYRGGRRPNPPLQNFSAADNDDYAELTKEQDHHHDCHNPPLDAYAPEFRPDTNNTAATTKNTSKRQRQRRKHPPSTTATATIEETEPPPSCLLCCNPMEIISFGECNHRVACAMCCLRLRKCYSKTTCPLCNQDLQQIVIAPWREDLPSFSDFILDNKKALHINDAKNFGLGTLLIDTWNQLGSNKPSQAKLHRFLLNKVSISCSMCDHKGIKPFVRQKELLDHVEKIHSSHLCKICLYEGRVFPLDLEVYTTGDALKEHRNASHPRCEFCRRHFYDIDTLWQHMLHQHHKCELCSPTASGDYPYFATVESLQQHYQSDHFACGEPECVATLVAFATDEELKRHHIQIHSNKLQRWNAAGSRPLHIDIQFVRRPGLVTGGYDAGITRSNRGRRGQDRRSVRISSRIAANAADPHGPSSSMIEQFQVGDDNYRIIDDDVGLLNDAEYSRYLATHRTEQHRNAIVNGAHGNNRLRAAEEQFPVLSTAMPPFVHQQQQQLCGAGSRRPLVKQTVRCPCGRRVSHFVVEEGQDVPELVCDAVCHVEGRRAKLADAFGVDNPDMHVSIFDKKDAIWNGKLLSAAKKNRTLIEKIEKELATFIADSQAKRYTMAPMPRAQRAIVHEMAEQYGLATVSSGHEPFRCVELYKTGSACTSESSSRTIMPTVRYGIPQKLLSKVALIVSDEEIESLLKAANGYPVKFVDVAPSTDLYYYLRRWDNERWKLEWLNASEAVCTFAEERDKNDMLDSFGGGIRGIFRIDRSWAPRTGVLTSEGRGGGLASPWAINKDNDVRNGDGAAGGGPSKWTDVASIRAPAQSAVMEQKRDESGQRSGWTVIGGKRGAMVQPRVFGDPAGKEVEKARIASFEALTLHDGD